MRSDPRLISLIGDVSNFARVHKVQDKASKAEIPFAPLPMQVKIFDAIAAGHTRIAIIKARQVAATTACKLVLHQLAYASPNAAMHAVVSLRADSASALLDDNRRWLTHLPQILQRPLRSKSKSEFVYADTGASIKAFTSRSTTGLRSFAPASLLLSEFAFAPDQAELLAQALSAVGDGLCIIESTANAPGDVFSRIVSAEDEGWHVITMWWWEHPAYRDDVGIIPNDFAQSLTDAEKQVQSAYGLDLGQLHWRRRMMQELKSESKFRREFPADLNDCFLAREGGYVSEDELANVHVLDFSAGGVGAAREIEAPNIHDRYVMGIDVGGGVGGDYSTIAVVSVSTRQLCYSVRSNALSPTSWAHKAIQVATRYNMAFILAESNNHGHALLAEIANCAYRLLWLNPKTGKPWVTTLQSKLEAFDTLRECLPIMKVMDRTTWAEIRALTIPAGKVAPEAPAGMNDDSAVALALALVALRDAPPGYRAAAIAAPRNRVEDLIAANRARKIRAAGLPF